ncbi:MAG TPA: hypothetical protein VI981_03180 [Candidatus Paceibacterota bacterium]
MHIALIGGSYMYWHYVLAWKSIWAIWKNIAWFLTHFFSLRLLTRTFFTPWKRMQEERKRGFSAADFFSSILVNTILRLVGMAARAAVLLVGLVALIVHAVIGIVVFAAWLFVPFVLLAGFIKGVLMIF